MRIFKKIRLRKLLGKMIPKPKPMAALAVFYTAFCLLSPSVVLADFFYGSGGDPFYCAFAGTFGVQYNSIGGGGVQWNNGDVQGINGNWIQGTPVSGVTAVNGFYGDRYDNARRVAVPPNTQVEIGYWVWNLAGHDVHVPRIDLFTSRPNPAEGDVTRLGASGNYQTICDAVGGCRSGKMISTGDQGNFGYDPGGGRGGSIIHTFNTIQPIQQVGYNVSQQWSGGNLTLRYDLTLTNVSTYNVGNIRVVDSLPSGATFDQTFSFAAGQTQTITYYDNLGTSYPTTISNTATVYDNNRYVESVSRPKSHSQDTSYDAQAGLIWRNDHDSPPGWYAPQGSWASHNFSLYEVEIIPYYFETVNVTTDVSPNLNIVKRVSDSNESNVTNNTASNRENITYTISVTNSGGRATGVSVIDDYDQSLITILNAGGGNDNGNTITWSNLTIENGQTLNFTIQARINDLAHGNYSINNTARTTPFDDSSTVITTVRPRANVNINKVVTDSNENNVKTNSIQGDHFNESERRLRFTLNYNNSGDADSTGVVITDTLTQFVNAGIFNRVENISNGGTFNSGTNVITWNIGNLNDGNSGSVSFDLILNRYANQDLSLINTSTIDSSETTPNTSTTTTNVLTPELQITKTDNRTNANAGETLTYEVTVSNIGTGNAYNLKIDDILPDQFITLDESSISNNGVYDSSTRTITWENTSVPEGIFVDSGQTLTFTFNVNLDALMPLGISTITNNASVITPLIPEITTSDTTDVLAMPNLEITKLVQNQTAINNGRSNSGDDVTSPDYGADANSWLDNENDVRAIAGDEIQFTLIYRNNGSAHAPDVFVVDHLPKYILDENGNQYQIIRFEDLVAIDDGLSLVDAGDNWDIVWDIGELQVGQEYQVKQFTIRINPDSSVTLSPTDTERIFDNLGEIYSTDARIESDSDNALVRVDQPNVVITKVSDKTQYQSDEQILYTIRVENTGDARATGTVTDTMPEGLTYVSSNPQASSIDGRTITWNIDINAGEFQEIQLVTSFTPPVSDNNNFINEVEYTYTDINTNVRPEVNTNIGVAVLAPVLQLEKVQNLPEIVAPGQPISYTLTYRNVGTGYAPNVTLTDPIPEHTLFVAVDEDNSDALGSYDAETNSVIWNLETLDPGEEGSVTFTVVIQIPTASGTEIRNTAVIYSPVVETISSETIVTTAEACCMGGNIWDDANKNGEYDANEYGIEGARIRLAWRASEFLPENEIELFTDQNGHYVHTGLPYYVPMKVTVELPNGFDEFTTTSEYTIALLPPRADGVPEDYEEDGVRYVTASGCITFLNAGIYRDIIIADTGDSIMVPLFTGFTLIALGLSLGILAFRKKSK